MEAEEGPEGGEGGVERGQGVGDVHADGEELEEEDGLARVARDEVGDEGEVGVEADLGGCQSKRRELRASVTYADSVDKEDGEGGGGFGAGSVPVGIRCRG